MKIRFPALRGRQQFLPRNGQCGGARWRWRITLRPDNSIFRAAADAGKVLAPAKNLDEMRQIVLNDTIDAVMAFIFVLLVASMIYFGVRACIDAWRASGWTARELPAATNGPQVAVPAE
jgi:hypothetical protein